MSIREQLQAAGFSSSTINELAKRFAEDAAREAAQERLQAEEARQARLRNDQTLARRLHRPLQQILECDGHIPSHWTRTA